MKKLLLQLDSAPHPSVFDRVVGYDGGADEILSYGSVTEDAVRDLVHGAIFTRGPRDLHNSAIFIGGTEMASGERLLTTATKAFFGPLRVSVMLDSNGSNTTASAAVVRLMRAAGGDVKGRRAVVTAGTGPVGLRAAGLLARAGAHVVITSRKPATPAMAEAITSRFGGTVEAVTMADASGAAAVLEGAEIVLNAGPAGVCLIPKSAWAGRAGLAAIADVNAVPPAGIEGIDVMDDGVERDGAIAFGALGVGKLKMKVHKACIARLFERNDQILDAETIFELASSLT